MSDAYEVCTGCPSASVMSDSGILGDTSSKGKSKVPSSSWGLPLFLLIISGKVNESQYLVLTEESNTSRFFIYESRNNLSGVSLRIVRRGTICPCCFITHCDILFPSLFSVSRQQPKHVKDMKIFLSFIGSTPIHTSRIGICWTCLPPHQILHSEGYVPATETDPLLSYL